MYLITDLIEQLRRKSLAGEEENSGKDNEKAKTSRVEKNNFTQKNHREF